MSLLRLAQKRPFNVGAVERAVSGAAGWKLVRTGLRRRSLPGLFLAGVGAMLIRRCASGRCPVYTRMGVVRHPNRQGGLLQAPVRIGSSIVIHRPRQEVYAFWSDLERLGQALRGIVDVRAETRTVSSWFVRVGRRDKRWTARLTKESPGELLAWETVPPSDVQHEGSVRFLDWSGGGETLVVFEGVWDAPAAALAGGARVLARNALRRIKAVIEAGEVPVARSVSARRTGASERREGRGRVSDQAGTIPRLPPAGAPPQPQRVVPASTAARQDAS